MCKAWDDQKEAGRVEGRAEGRAEGRTEGIFTVIRILLQIKISKEDILSKLVDNFSISEVQANQYYNQCEQAQLSKA